MAVTCGPPMLTLPATSRGEARSRLVPSDRPVDLPPAALAGTPQDAPPRAAAPLPLPTLPGTDPSQRQPAPVTGATQPFDGAVIQPADDIGRQPASFRPVKVGLPRLRVDGVGGRRAARKVRRLDGVSHTAELRLGTVTIKRRDVRVAAVRPRQFRVLTPQVTADEVGVWQRLIEGDAAFTHDAGNRLRAELGATVAAERGQTLRVGAYASNGVPPVADVVVSRATGDRLGLNGRRSLLVAVEDGVEPGALADAIEQATGGRVAVLEEPQTRRAFLTGADARSRFEPFDYVDYGDGMIQIDPAWVRRNIVRRQVPILRGEVMCHRLMVDQLAGALAEIEDRGLAHLIDPSDYGGCWVPRHIDFNPAKPLSMHAWGLAADFNVSTNGLGRRPTMDRRIVRTFERWGFVWGGRWSRPDGMHFELGALLDSPRG